MIFYGKTEAALTYVASNVGIETGDAYKSGPICRFACFAAVHNIRQWFRSLLFPRLFHIHFWLWARFSLCWCLRHQGYHRSVPYIILYTTHIENGAQMRLKIKMNISISIWCLSISICMLFGWPKLGALLDEPQSVQNQLHRQHHHHHQQAHHLNAQQ